MWKCNKCGSNFMIEASICIGAWVNAEIDMKRKDHRYTGSVDLKEVCWDDLNITVDSYDCHMCGNSGGKMEDVATWED